MISNLKSDKRIYIISNLNYRSVLLADSIKESSPLSTIIFANFSRGDKSQINHTKILGCRTTKKRISDIRLPRGNKKFTFILINDDENENINNALCLTALYRDKLNAEIYTFNSSKESECLLDSIYKGSSESGVNPIKLRRVNVIRNQIYYYLLKHSIFDDAAEEYNEKTISVLIAGLGSYGTEMLKALIWCGQMDGYVLRFHVIDKDPNAETRFYRECPGIRQRGTQPKSGEDYYELYFHSGIDVNTEEFTNTVSGLYNTTFAFVSLGNEQLNIETSIALRTLFSGMLIDSGNKPDHASDVRQKPHITAVVHSDDKAVLLKENRLSNPKGQFYQIDCIGSDSEQYSYKNVFYSELEELALTTHLQWGTKEEFNNYEYNRRSSMASAIHKKYRDLLMPDDETKDILEHKRWNAYMRSTEGYSFGLIRDDLALRHPLLVKYDHLSRAEKDKDTNANKAGKTIF